MTRRSQNQRDVSIVIPCFNGARYLDRLSRTLSAMRAEFGEVIFVDDGSSDGSAEIFAALMPDARVLRQPNAGVAAARNKGAAAATGRFLQFLDADDVILPGKLPAQVAAANEHKLDVIYSDWQMVVVGGETVQREPICSQPMPDEPVAALLSGWWAPPHAYLIRREAYESVGGSDSSLVNAQDFDLVLRLAIAGCAFGHVAGHYADYCRFLDVMSLARGPRRQYQSDYEQAVEKAIAQLHMHGALTCARRRAAALKLHSIARGVYSIDRSWFHRLESRIYEMDPQFKVPGSALYRFTVGRLGLHISEAVACWARTAPPLRRASASLAKWHKRH